MKKKIKGHLINSSLCPGGQQYYKSPLLQIQEKAVPEMSSIVKNYQWKLKSYNYLKHMATLSKPHFHRKGND